jgi:hypothetical protein
MVTVTSAAVDVPGAVGLDEPHALTMIDTPIATTASRRKE